MLILLSVLLVFQSGHDVVGNRAPPVQMNITGRAGACRMEAEGHSFMLPRDQRRLQAWLNEVSARGAEVHLFSVPGVSFRCVGSFIRIAQRARLRIGFISEPASPAH